MKENMEMQEKQVQKPRKVSVRRLMARLCVFVMIVAMFSVSAFAAEGDAASVLESASTITTLINAVFSMITGNWYLALIFCLSLLGLGIAALRRMKKAAR